VNKYIVCTTINPPTEALIAFDKMEDWTLIIVADLSTSAEAYKSACPNSVFLGCDEQAGLYPELSEMLGWRTVDRRNLGFLYAYEQGADVVAMVDDDNIPLPEWGEVRIGKLTAVQFFNNRALWFDPLAPLHYKYWHRGFPIHSVPYRHVDISSVVKDTFDIQANLWLTDPDIDAICRLQSFASVYDWRPVILSYYAANKPSPFNMQNTMISRRAMPLCPSIPETGRMCDIWGAYYCQVKGKFKVMYGPATVNHVQERTMDSVVDDMREEIIGYQHSDLLSRMVLEGADKALQSVLSTRSFEFVQAYQESFK